MARRITRPEDTPNFGNQDWYKKAYEKPPTDPAPPKTPEEWKEVVAANISAQQYIVQLEQQVKERDMLIAVLKDQIEQLKRGG